VIEPFCSASFHRVSMRSKNLPPSRDRYEQPAYFCPVALTSIDVRCNMPHYTTNVRCIWDADRSRNLHGHKIFPRHVCMTTHKFFFGRFHLVALWSYHCSKLLVTPSSSSIQWNSSQESINTLSTIMNMPWAKCFCHRIPGNQKPIYENFSSSHASSQ